jgi:radical SAM protein (TIGR01212 family)
MYIHTLSDELRRQFGGKVYKISLSGGMTCPNRDGTLGVGGCTFCTGSGEFAAHGDMAEQLKSARERVAFKAKNAQYIAYFQDHTNTYAPPERLRALFTAAMAPDDIVALSIGTRPDCLGPEVLDLLAELNEQKPVWVELGLQTVHDTTARAIRRGYDLPVFEAAVTALRQIGVTVIVHQIIGLPGETPEMIAQTADYIARCGAQGVKFHLLHVLRGTELAQEYAEGRVEVLSQEAYIALLEDCIRHQSREMVIHRMTGDGDKRILVAPLWSADKKRVLAAMQRAFERDDLEQGSLYREE